MKEYENEILIAVIDGSHNNYTTEENYEERSQLFLKGLKSEFRVSFEESNVGPGADIPAFETYLRENVFPLLPWMLAVFFSGKPVAENLIAWRELAKKVSVFFSREVVLGRNGAAVLVIDRTFDEVGGLPKHLRLLNYAVKTLGDSDDQLWGEQSGSIEASPPTINLGMVIHRFDIEADGVKFRAVVRGREVELRKLNS